jgi:hypothetical protein
VLNLSGGKETLVPERFLYGIIPQTLLENYVFWQDESIVPFGTKIENFVMANKSYKKLLGYPKNDSANDEFILIVEFVYTGIWTENPVQNIDKKLIVQITNFPGRTVRVIRRPKTLFEEEFHQKQRIAMLLESLNILVPPTLKIKKKKDDDDLVVEKIKFKIDEEVECIADTGDGF